MRERNKHTFATINPIPLVPPVTSAILPFTENKVLISVENILVVRLLSSPLRRDKRTICNKSWFIENE
jgi:hypothetical protein